MGNPSAPRSRTGWIGPWEGAFLALLALHLGALAAHHGFGLPYRHKAVFLFHADFERNLPTLFSVLLLLRASWTSWRCSDRPWRLLAGVFLFLAADEAFGLHERLIPLVRRGLEGGPLAESTLLTFGWILPYGILVALLGIFLRSWLRRLPGPVGRGLLAAAALYLTGALALEAVGGWWIGGDLSRRDLGYDLLVTAEEFLEMAGLLLYAKVAGGFPRQPP